MARRAFAVDAKCQIDGCAGMVKSRGLCGMHYMRWKRHGSTDVDIKKSGGHDFLKRCLDESAQDCVLWPFSINTDGYPILALNGRSYRANRFACEMAHGPAPSRSHHAAHSCGNRACVNPAHLRWATPAQNINDKWRHGTMPIGSRVHSAKLREADVREIKRRIISGDAQTEIARAFGVTKYAIGKIKAGINWGWVKV